MPKNGRSGADDSRCSIRDRTLGLGKGALACLLLQVALLHPNAGAATNLPAYYAHPAVEDAHGVIAPWYRGLNGQLPCRVRIGAETLKRYPWSDPAKAAA